MKKNTILPPTYFVIALILSLVLHFIFPIVKFIDFPVNLAGIVPVIFGIYLNLRADDIFKKLSTTVKPFEKPAVFVTEGPFRWCRHPMYLGMIAILLGLSILCGSITSFTGAIVFWLIIRLRFLPAEEKSMLDAFGETYIQYKNRVHSWM